MIQILANHLWQSTLFTAAAALMTLALRRNRAAVRHAVWLAASVKFVLPWALLAALGGQLGWLKPPAPVPSGVSFVVEEIAKPFPAPATAPTVASTPLLPAILVAVWLAGIAVLACRWWMRWRRVARIVREATPLPPRVGVNLVTSPHSLEPGVFGIFRPVLVLPAGIAGRLGGRQLDAIVAHELCHVRRRDNLAAAVHMLVEAIFWFHPLVWWLGARLVDERERACDEEVLRRGADPEIYAEGILNACRFYLESPLACVSGVTSAALEKRIERIMTPTAARRLDGARKLLLAIAAAAAVIGPIGIGALDAPRLHAQTAKLLQFDVASVKPTPHGTGNFRFSPDHGGLIGANIGLKQYMAYAFNVQHYQLAGDLGDLASETYDIVGKAPPDTKDDQRRLMLQSLLIERFKLVTHRDARQMSIFELVVAKNGPKFEEAPADRPGNGNFRTSRGRIVAQGGTMEDLASILSGTAGRPVIDRTNLRGKYDFTLQYLPDSPREPGDPNEAGPDPNGLSLFGALEQQLRLKLESAKGGVEMVVIDHVEKPTGN